MTDPVFKPAAGEEVDQRYRLEEELGRGGMGSVWRAHHLSLDIPCAVKFIDEAVVHDELLRSRFRQEARAAARLPNRHVVQMFDHGLWQGTPYIAMELLRGSPLSTRLERQGRLSPALTVGVLRGVVEALTKAHDLGIVHRDLKPENIFLLQDGDYELAKVLDFGVAKLTSNALLASDHNTGTGALLGTPYYMSPEQALGDSEVDHRSDLWSLAVIAYECLTGRLPFDRAALGALLMAIMNEPLPRLTEAAPDLPAALDGWWSRAADRDPEYRFQTAPELLAELEEALSEVLEEAPASRWSTLSKRPDGAEAQRFQATKSSRGDVAEAATVVASDAGTISRDAEPSVTADEGPPATRPVGGPTRAGAVTAGTGTVSPVAQRTDRSGRGRGLALIGAVVGAAAVGWLVFAFLGEGGEPDAARQDNPPVATAGSASPSTVAPSDLVAVDGPAVAPAASISATAGASPTTSASAGPAATRTARSSRPPPVRPPAPRPTATTTQKQRPDPGY